jgi:pterin-4a-carbinolamine dehydratase
MARLSDEEIDERLAQLEGWERAGDAIQEISWETVAVTITTHSQGALTANDFELAAKIDASAE